MKLTQTQIEQYAKDYIESKTYLDTLEVSRRKINTEIEEQNRRHETIENEILAKFENPAPLAVIVGKKIFTIEGQYSREKTNRSTIQIWDAALS